MSYRYIALVKGDSQESCQLDADAQVVLHGEGLRHRLSSGPIDLFVSERTPTYAIAGGGIVIGQLFFRGGRPIRDSTRLPDFPDPIEMRRHLREQCWGDYLVLQPVPNGHGDLTVARDPSGGVGCVYSINQSTGFITSDISLATRLDLYRRRIDWEFIAQFLSCSHLKTRRTGLADMHELLPGCTLHLRAGAVMTECEWTPWDFVVPDGRHQDPREASFNVRKVVQSTVKATADTEESILLELSGGLDSSIVAASLRGTQARVACCTLVTPVPGADERQYASQMAGYLGVELHAEHLQFDDARFDFKPLPQAVVPSITALQYATNVRVEAIGDRLGATGFLSGGGGDTVFGYLSTAAPAADAFRERGLAGMRAAIGDLSELHRCTLWRAGRLTLKKLLSTPKASRRADHSFLNPARIVAPMEEHPWVAAPDGAFAGDRERIADLAATQLFREGLARGTNRRLHMPLLSQPVMEACLQVPSWMWIAGGRNRSVARSAFADALPEDILERRSKGTFASYSGAVFRRNKDRIRNFLLTGQLEATGLLDTGALTRFFDGSQSPPERSFQRIFELCMIENWARHQT